MALGNSATLLNIHLDATFTDCIYAVTELITQVSPNAVKSAYHHTDILRYFSQCMISILESDYTCKNEDVEYFQNNNWQQDIISPCGHINIETTKNPLLHTWHFLNDFSLTTNMSFSYFNLGFGSRHCLYNKLEIRGIDDYQIAVFCGRLLPFSYIPNRNQFQMILDIKERMPNSPTEIYSIYMEHHVIGVDEYSTFKPWIEPIHQPSLSYHIGNEFLKRKRLSDFTYTVLISTNIGQKIHTVLSLGNTGNVSSIFIFDI